MAPFGLSLEIKSFYHSYVTHATGNAEYPYHGFCEIFKMTGRNVNYTGEKGIEKSRVKTIIKSNRNKCCLISPDSFYYNQNSCRRSGSKERK